MKVTVLGSGSAPGIPAAGGYWFDCIPENPKNLRLRSSLLIEHEGKKIVVDVGPDFREQSIRYRIDRVDAVFVSHAHYDHFFGMPDLSTYAQISKRSVPVFAHKSTWKAMEPTIDWLLVPSPPDVSVVERHDIEYGLQMHMAEISAVPFKQRHGAIDSAGLRIGRFAYSPDVSSMPEESMALLEGLETWILECDSIEPYGYHNHLAQALEWVARLKPERTFLTHISPFVDHNQLASRLPENVFVAYDGLVF